MQEAQHQRSTSAPPSGTHASTLARAHASLVRGGCLSSHILAIGVHVAGSLGGSCIVSMAQGALGRERGGAGRASVDGCGQAGAQSSVRNLLCAGARSHLHARAKALGP